MNFPVTHVYDNEYGQEVTEKLSAVVVHPPSQLIDWGELEILNRRKGTLAILRGRQLGDLVMLTATLRVIHDLLPDIRVHLFCDAQYIPLFAHHPGVYSVGPLELYYDSGFDCVVDLNMYVEAHEDAWRVDRTSLFARAFGIVLQDGRPWLHGLNADWGAWADENLGTDGRALVIIAPDCSDWRRSLTGEFIDELSELLEDIGLETFITGTNRGKLIPLHLLYAIVARAELVVTADNGVSHIAGCAVCALAGEDAGPVSIPIYTTIPCELRSRWYPHPMVPIQADISCSPCNDHPIAGCNVECRSKISAQDVVGIYEAIRSM